MSLKATLNSELNEYIKYVRHILRVLITQGSVQDPKVEQYTKDLIDGLFALDARMQSHVQQGTCVILFDFLTALIRDHPVCQFWRRT